MSIQLRGGTVLTPFEGLEGINVTVVGSKITSLTAHDSEGGLCIDVSGKIVIPGLIDIHMHGGFGWEVIDGPPSEELLGELARRGTTSFLPTIYPTGDRDGIVTAICAYRKFLEGQYSGARILGLHMEGPFLNPLLGAQRPEYCEIPRRDGFEMYLDEAGDALLMMTLSPELEGSIELIESLKQKSIVPAVGHSAAGKDVLERAFSAGLRHGTHIFNATSRPESPFGKGAMRSNMDEFCLVHDEMSADIMVDGKGMHFDDVHLQLVWKCKGPERLLVISDSTQVAGLPPGEYDWDDRKIVVDGGDVGYLDNVGLAGSTMTIIGPLKNIMNRLNLPLENVLCTATVNPARLLGLEHAKGSIAPGMDADIVVVDKSLNVYLTMVEGEIVYRDELLPVVRRAF
jgi:N-acetylglucosamine-6-phosphate deacetylase